MGREDDTVGEAWIANVPVLERFAQVADASRYAALPDEWRWRFMHYSFATQTPPPHGSTLRVSRHPNAHFHFSKAVSRAASACRRIGSAGKIRAACAGFPRPRRPSRRRRPERGDQGRARRQRLPDHSVFAELGEVVSER